VNSGVGGFNDQRIQGCSPGWGSSTGNLGLRGAGPLTYLSPLDRQLISERVHYYGWACDERRSDLLADCFTEDASWSGSLMGEETVPAVHGRDAIVVWLSGFWHRQVDQRRHMMTSLSIDSQGPAHASAIASLLLMSAAASSIAIVLTSFYRFELTKDDGVWRISSLFEGFDVPF